MGNDQTVKMELKQDITEQDIVTVMLLESLYYIGHFLFIILLFYII